MRLLSFLHCCLAGIGKINAPARALVAFGCLAALVGASAFPARAETTIRFRYWGDVKETAIIQDIVRRFEETHPGVHVSAERAPAGTAYTVVVRARDAAESGLRWISWRFVKMNRPKTATGNITSAVADTLWPTICNSVPYLT